MNRRSFFRLLASAAAWASTQHLAWAFPIREANLGRRYGWPVQCLAEPGSMCVGEDTYNTSSLYGIPTALDDVPLTYRPGVYLGIDRGKA